MLLAVLLYPVPAETAADRNEASDREHTRNNARRMRAWSRESYRPCHPRARCPVHPRTQRVHSLPSLATAGCTSAEPIIAAARAAR